MTLLSFPTQFWQKLYRNSVFHFYIFYVIFLFLFAYFEIEYHYFSQAGAEHRLQLDYVGLVSSLVSASWALVLLTRVPKPGNSLYLYVGECVNPEPYSLVFSKRKITEPLKLLPKEVPETPKTTQTTVIAIGFPPELYGKALLLKTSQALVVDHKEIKFVLGCKLLSCWLAFMVPSGAI